MEYGMCVCVVRWFNMKLILVFSCFEVDCMAIITDQNGIFYLDFSFSLLLASFNLCWIGSHSTVSDRMRFVPNHTCYNIIKKLKWKLKSPLMNIYQFRVRMLFFFYCLLFVVAKFQCLECVENGAIKKIFRENHVFTRIL